MSTLFDPRVRVLACDNCGAPLEGSSGAADVACRYCGAVNDLELCEELPPELPLPPGEQMRRLAAQVGRPRPSSVAPDLLEGKRLAPWREREALAAWVELRRQVRTADSAALAFFELTRLLADAAHAAGDGLRARSLLETGYEVSRLPRQRTYFAAVLAQRAALAGDVPSAESWIARGSAGTDDLEAFSALVVAQALVARREGPDAVLAVIGLGRGAAPLYYDDEPLGALLRADALERSGRIDEAVLLLERQVLARPPVGRAALALAEHTLGDDVAPRARAALQERRGRVHDRLPRYHVVVAVVFAALWGSPAVAGMVYFSRHWAWLIVIVGSATISALFLSELRHERAQLGAWRRPLWATVKSIKPGNDSNTAELELDDAPGDRRAISYEKSQRVEVGMRVLVVPAGDSLRWLS